MEGALVDIQLPECARRTATINAVSRQKGKFMLKLSLEEDDSHSGTEVKVFSTALIFMFRHSNWENLLLDV